MRTPAFWLASGAVGWAAAFTAWALTASVYSDGQTILEANPETVVRIAIAAPLVLTLIVWTVLHVACRTGRAGLRTIGTVLAWILLAFAIVSGFSIGMAFLPGAALLALAAGLTPVRES
jgi:hypothetical protein